MAVMEDKVLALKDGCVDIYGSDSLMSALTWSKRKQTGEVSRLTVKRIPYVTVKFDTPLLQYGHRKEKMHLSSALNHGTEDAMPQILPAHCSSATQVTAARSDPHGELVLVDAGEAVDGHVGLGAVGAYENMLPQGGTFKAAYSIAYL